ncbi:filamentous hemagglutinin N-terminal domain-containing protein, partial [Selenomonas sp. KH1T6]|uniref:two-partner secretion domain-containing protein n=1 Tax=Selenomonas sp. KH1T6 TaxID=3158784 RepID=UPI0008A79ED7
MGDIAKYRKRKVALLTAAVVASAWTPTAWALPQNPGNVENLDMTIDEKNLPENGKINGKDLEITLKEGFTRGAVDWKSFDIASGEKVNFNGPEALRWMVLNRVTGTESSDIYGSLTSGANGTIFLVNPNGILFGKGAQVDVGSLVASTMDIEPDDFINNTFLFNETGKNKAVTIKKGADITARDGYVAIFAHEINNAGTITAPEVAMAAGKSIELSYDDKINLVVNVSNDSKKATVDTKNNYVLMTAEDASNIIGDSIINNSGTINAATKIEKDEDGKLTLSGDGGKIDMVAARVLVNGELNADGDKGGTITTSGYEVMQVNDGSKVHAASKDGEAGTWNVIGKNATIDSGVTGTDLSNDNNGVTKGVNKISNTVVSNSLANTNVSVEASPDKETYYSDVRVNKAVEKTSGDKTTTLTLTAGRNVIVEDDIKSSAGALNVKLNSDVKKHTENDAAEDNTQDEITNSGRTDGANIIKADIETNGGDFTTTGELGTYFGMKEVAQAGSDAKRYVKTNGGNISLGGQEVLLATGGTVELDTTTTEGKNGTVTIEGSVNSANAYQSKHESKRLIWSEATQKAKDVSEKSHLVVITGALEDAVATSTINTDFSDTAEAFIGGHVVAVAMEQDADGNSYPVDANGNFITMTDGVLSADPVPKNGKGTVETLDGISENVPGNTSGWYNLKDGSHARFWAWTEGEEKGTIFYVQTVGEVIENHEGNSDTAWQSKSHGYALKDEFGREYYTNFAPGEPNDDKSQTGQTALAVNYDTYKSNQRKDLLYSQWDDINDHTSGNPITYYVVETDLDHTSLNIKADDTLIKGSVGNTNKLNNLNIDSTGSVTVNGSIEVDNHVDAKAQNNATFNKFIDAKKDYVKLEAIKGNVTADGAVKAGTDIIMNAGKNVTSGDIVKAGRDVTMDAKGNVLAKGDVTAVRNVDMKAVGNVTAEKNITAGNYVHASTDGDIITNGAVLAEALDVNLDAQKGSVTTSGTVTAKKDNVTLTAGEDVNINAAVTTGKDMSAHAGNNVTTAEAGAIKAENGSIELVATNNNVNVNGAVTIGQDFTAEAGNNATINVAVNAANGEVSMKAGKTLKTTDVTAGKNVKAEGNDVNTTGKVEAKGGAVTMTATNELKAVNVTAATDVTGSGKDIN